jgi:hypothetical protein
MYPCQAWHKQYTTLVFMQSSMLRAVSIFLLFVITVSSVTEDLNDTTEIFRQASHNVSVALNRASDTLHTEVGTIELIVNNTIVDINDIMENVFVNVSDRIINPALISICLSLLMIVVGCIACSYMRYISHEYTRAT